VIRFAVGRAFGDLLAEAVVAVAGAVGAGVGFFDQPAEAGVAMGLGAAVAVDFDHQVAVDVVFTAVVHFHAVLQGDGVGHAAQRVVDFARDVAVGGGAGVAWDTVPRLRNGVALQGDTPTPHLCSGSWVQGHQSPD